MCFGSDFIAPPHTGSFLCYKLHSCAQLCKLEMNLFCFQCCSEGKPDLQKTLLHSFCLFKTHLFHTYSTLLNTLVISQCPIPRAALPAPRGSSCCRMFFSQNGSRLPVSLYNAVLHHVKLSSFREVPHFDLVMSLSDDEIVPALTVLRSMRMNRN